MANYGQCIFEETLYRLLMNSLPSYDVRYLDYSPRNRYYHELLRAFKPHPNALTHNLKRYIQSERFHRRNVRIEKPSLFYPLGYEKMVGFLRRRNYDALVTTMVVWDISNLVELPRFPNIYWLSEKILSKKIAYAVSGHRSNIDLVQKNLSTIQRILGSYALIGVRDHLTWKIVLDSKVDQYVPVIKVPDPAFMFEKPLTDIRTILTTHNVDINQPVLGILLYGKPEFSKALCSFYRSKGFQTVALSMYNPYADINLGHLISPHEWADAFQYLSFCVTDRLHGTIFCLKNNIPFISIEPGTLETIDNSKIYSLLSDFDLFECYMDVLQVNFKMADFLERSEELRKAWERDYQFRVLMKVKEMQNRSLDFINQVKLVLS